MTLEGFTNGQIDALLLLFGACLGVLLCGIRGVAPEGHGSTVALAVLTLLIGMVALPLAAARSSGLTVSIRADVEVVRDDAGDDNDPGGDDA